MSGLDEKIAAASNGASIWIVLAVAIWDGCKAIPLRLRFVLLLLQAVVAFCASALFFQHLLGRSL